MKHDSYMLKITGITFKRNSYLLTFMYTLSVGVQIMHKYM